MKGVVYLVFFFVFEIGVEVSDLLRNGFVFQGFFFNIIWMVFDFLLYKVEDFLFFKFFVLEI